MIELLNYFISGIFLGIGFAPAIIILMVWLFDEVDKDNYHGYGYDNPW
jgi:hypothetical protein